MQRRPTFLLPLASSLLALFLLMTPQAASANATSGLCGSAGVNPWVCALGDYHTIAETCDRLCPDWTWFQCIDMSLSCYNDPW
jgi:hypothetical protein